MKKALISSLALALFAIGLNASAHTENGPWTFKYRGNLHGSFCSCMQSGRGVIAVKNQRYNADSTWFALNGEIFRDFESCYQFLDDNHHQYLCGFLTK